jgi:hypothetical protein
MKGLLKTAPLVYVTGRDPAPTLIAPGKLSMREPCPFKSD